MVTIIFLIWWKMYKKSQSDLNIWMLQFYSVIICKTASALSGWRGSGEVWTLTQPLQNNHLVVSKPFLHNFLCLLWVIVLLENRSSPKLLFSSRLNQVVLQEFTILYFAAFILPSTFTSLAGPAAEKKIASSLMDKNICFGLIRPKNLLPLDLEISEL